MFGQRKKENGGSGPKIFLKKKMGERREEGKAFSGPRGVKEVKTARKLEKCD